MSDSGLTWLAGAVREYFDTVVSVYREWCESLQIEVCSASWNIFLDLYSDVIFPGQHSYFSK